jgi:DmpG-like communication domain
VPAHEILARIGQAGYAGGQEDMIIDVALAIRAENAQRLGSSAQTAIDLREEFLLQPNTRVGIPRIYPRGGRQIQEIKVLGDWAFAWAKLTVVVTPPDGGPPITRDGHTLSIFRKDGGRWLLARDSNTLPPPPSSP